MKYGGPSGGSPLLGGGIIILRVIRGTSLLRSWTQLSASPRQYSSNGSCSLTTLTTPRREHQGGGRRRGLGMGQRGAGEDTAVEARAKRNTRVRWFVCGVRLPSPQ